MTKPRKLTSALNIERYEFQCLSDAFEWTYEANIYILSIDENAKTVTCRLLCAKSKIRLRKQFVCHD